MDYTMQDVIRMMEFMTEYPMLRPTDIVIKMLAATEVLEGYNRRLADIMTEACFPPKLEVVVDEKKGDTNE